MQFEKKIEEDGGEEDVVYIRAWINSFNFYYRHATMSNWNFHQHHCDNTNHYKNRVFLRELWDARKGIKYAWKQPQINIYFLMCSYQGHTF